eukprot:9502346-Pyramimonas_sp.AAC.4
MAHEACCPGALAPTPRGQTLYSRGLGRGGRAWCRSANAVVVGQEKPQCRGLRARARCAGSTPSARAPDLGAGTGGRKPARDRWLRDKCPQPR